MKELVSITCGHSFCRQCISSYWEQSASAGHYACPQCRKRSRTRPMLHAHTAPAGPVQELQLEGSDIIRTAQEKHRSRLKEKYGCIFEGTAKQGCCTHLREVYTELYITEGDSEGVNNEHEVWQIETASRTQTTQDIAINCNDIFKPSAGRQKPIRTVLTKGIAGIGKTVSVQKFIMDWAEGKANQDVHFILALPFRELNLVKHKEFSLMGLLYHHYPEMKDLGNIASYNLKVLLIFDGLDECRLPLDYQNNERWCDVTASTSVDMLLTNLIKGNLLPSALLWITSRPAAANRIPSDSIHQVTEVRGFNDPQKEEYFRKKIKDENLAERIISHVKSSRSLYIMCHIPVFCWISAAVLEIMLHEADSGEIPKTLTQMYTHFLLIQTNLKNCKYHGRGEVSPRKLSEMDREIILKLGELAFQHLENGNLIFYEKDVRAVGISVAEAVLRSGVCTEIFREERVTCGEKVYCFVHLSVQEYLAALHVLHSYLSKRTDVLTPPGGRKARGASLSDLLKGAVDRAMESPNGHLDLFLRFLLGISLESTRALLQGLLGRAETGRGADGLGDAVRYIKGLKRKDPPPERCINLLHCLSEVNDTSLVGEIRAFLGSGDRSGRLTQAHCSALAFVLLMSEDPLDELDLKAYNTSADGRRRLVAAARNCRKALMNHCSLTGKSCETVASALQSANSHLRELDLSNNHLRDSGVKLLCTGLKSPHCKLGTLRLGWCGLTEVGCVDLASVLCSPHSELTELELRDNDLQDSGVRALSAGLEDSSCKLQRLGLSGFRVTERGCASLASALHSNPSHLRELDLSYNHPGESGVRALSAGLEDPYWKLEKLNVDHGGECRTRPGLQKYACQLTLDPNTAHRELSLSEGDRKVTRGREEQPYPDRAERFDQRRQILCREGLSGRCYWEAEWLEGGAAIGVAYRRLERKGAGDDSHLGLNAESWSLDCAYSSCTARHNRRRIETAAPPAHAGRVGVFLDWPAGTLSFYRVSPKTVTLLHTFHATFTEPLYPGFYVTSSWSLS
ncbi:hypothetical protein MATL_G00219360 [Megalops atlanticus]|uniref:NACHT, LRR and PYD domains-containing protein 12-like n=1 Tax=Megalops atlanticus TaxID=7932 RepID=A0A9D3SY65_MEGAT|nr:hypothetical protein MATL_G00219360 [Megalops atlanticus]